MAAASISGPPIYLTIEQKAFYEENGYIVIEKFFNDGQVDQLRGVMGDIVSKFEPSSHPKSIFTTTEQDRQTDDYFLDSGYAIRYFWEERAWQNGELVVPAQVAINKVGHGLHELVPEFETISFDPRLGTICRELGMEKPLNVQSMYIFKQAKIGGEVGAHQDGSFLYTEPQTVIGFWWAFDDCTTENGCLWAVPGSHRLGVHRRFRRKDPPQKGTEFSPVEGVQWDLSTAVPLVIPRGSLVILHAAVVHYSEKNDSENCRHAYSIHVVDGKDGVQYPSDNWLQRPADHPFREIPALI